MKSMFIIGILLCYTPIAFVGVDICVGIPENTKRLECFDREIKTPEKKPKKSWEVSEDINPLDDSKTVTMALAATEGVNSHGQPPVLLIRCKSKETEVFVAWRDYLGSEAQVTTRIGQLEPKTQRWSMSTDSKATFYPGNDVQFVRSWIGQPRLVVRVTPYNENPVVAVFDLTSLEEALKPLREVCGW